MLLSYKAFWQTHWVWPSIAALCVSLVSEKSTLQQMAIQYWEKSRPRARTRMKITGRIRLLEEPKVGGDLSNQRICRCGHEIIPRPASTSPVHSLRAPPLKAPRFRQYQSSRAPLTGTPWRCRQWGGGRVSFHCLARKMLDRFPQYAHWWTRTLTNIFRVVHSLCALTGLVLGPHPLLI